MRSHSASKVSLANRAATNGPSQPEFQQQVVVFSIYDSRLTIYFPLRVWPSLLATA